MNSKLACAAMVVLTGAGAAVARPDYPDPVGDLDPFFLNQGFTHLDITNVSVTNDLENLYISFAVNGDIAATNWGKYCLLFDTKPGGVSTPSNPWGRSITTDRLNDFWMGSWVDGGGGAQLWKNDGTVWEGTEFAATYIAGSGITQDLSQAPAGIASYSIRLSNLGLAVGNSFFFDAIATAGGTTDPGVDHLSRSDPATPNWGTASITGDYRQYTVVPGAGTGAALGLAALAATGRRRR